MIFNELQFVCCILIFSQPVVKSTSNVKAATLTFKPLNYKGGIAVGKAFNLLDFVTEVILESVGFDGAHVVLTAATPEVADWALQPREPRGLGLGLGLAVDVTEFYCMFK